jgi:Ca-activated chloride channel family protein
MIPKKTGRIFWLVVLICSLPRVVHGQAPNPDGPPSGPDRQHERIVVDVDLVNISFSVLDKKGGLVTDLARDDFKVFENNNPQTITNFSQETNLPMTVAMLIDSSNSIREKIRFEQEAAIDFFHTTLLRKRDKGALISFDSNVQVLQDFTDDPDVLTKAVKRLKSGGGTKMYDAIYMVSKEKLINEFGSRNVILLISDGEDNMSSESFESALEMAQRAEVSIYTISTNASGFFGMASPKHDKILRKLAEETGGRIFFPAKSEDLAQSFYEVAQELRNQYSLAYRSTYTVRDGSFRTVRIESDRKNVRIKARKGYYAPRRSS